MRVVACRAHSATQPLDVAERPIDQPVRCGGGGSKPYAQPETFAALNHDVVLRVDVVDDERLPKQEDKEEWGWGLRRAIVGNGSVITHNFTTD